MSGAISIIQKLVNTPLQQMPVENGMSITPQAQAIYTLIDDQTGQYPEGVELQQLGDDLQVVRDGEVLLVIEGFYEEIGQGMQPASFDEFASIVIPENMQPMESPVWHEEMDVVVSLDDNEATEPAVVEQGEMLSSKPMVDTASDENVAEVEESDSGMGWGWYAAAGLGALALGGASGGDSSGGSSSSSSSVTISAAAGVFFSEVQVDLYREDGTLLSSENHDYSTGDYVYTGSYSGAILVEITDINGDAGDYTDETTGESKSLGTTLRAMATTDGDGEEAISVTPLTELATQLAGVTTGEAFTTEDVEVNDKVADLFGLDDLLAKPTVLTEETEGADEASLKYGEALAILSGADSANGTTATETITAIAESLTNDDGSLVESEDGELQLTSGVTSILSEGLEAFNESELGSEYTISEGFDFISAPTLVDADGEGLGWINSFLVETEKENSINVKIKGVSVDDEVTVSVGEESTSLTVTADDIVDDAYVLIPIQGSWFDGEDGTYTVTVSVNGEEQDVLVKLDTQAPEDAVIALANDAGSEADDYLTSDATVNVTLADDTVTWEYSLEGGVNWVEGEGTSFELSEGTYAEGEIQVRQFDAADNITITEFSETVTIDLTGPDEAPTIALAEDTGSSDGDQVTSNGLVNVILTGDAVAWEYSVDAGVTWQAGTDSSFTIEEGVYAEGDVQVRQSDEAGNVSEVAGLSTITVDMTAPDSTAFSIDGTTVAVTLSDDENSWEYSLDGGDSWATGSDASFEILEDTTYAAGDIQVRETDVAGNVSDVVSNETEVLVDTSAPTAPTIALAEDTGSSDGDQVTSNGLVNVTLTGDAVAWEYSVDAGVTWQTGTDSSFTLEEGVYAEGDVQVRQSDAAGNVSEVAELGEMTVDVTAPDSTTFSIDYTTVTVTLSDDENSWEYSLDGGDSWTTGSDASFEILEDTTYAVGDIQVRETDVAGNESAVVSNEQSVVVSSGSSESDPIMGVEVILSDDTTFWEYSTDGGSSWQDGLVFLDFDDEAFEDAGLTLNDGDLVLLESDFEGYLVDDNGDRLSEIDLVNSGEDGDYLYGLAFGVSAEAVGWEISVDGGESFITQSWGDQTLDALALVSGTTYDAGDVQIRETDSDGNLSAVRSTDAAIEADDESDVSVEIDAATGSVTFVEDSSADFEGSVSTNSSAISHELAGDYSDILTLSYSDGSFVQAWVEHNEDEDVQYLIVQKYTSSGVEDGLYYGIEIGDGSEEYTLKDIDPVGTDGAFVISWFSGDDEESAEHFVRSFDDLGNPIGETISLPASDGWAWASDIVGSTDSDVFSVAWTEGDEEDQVSFVQLYDGETGDAIGSLIEYEDSVGPVVFHQDDGTFYVARNDVVDLDEASAIVVIQAYDASGNAVGDSLTLNPDAGAYFEDYLTLNTGETVFMLFNESEMSVSLAIVEGGELVSTIDLASDLHEEYEVEFTELNDDGDFAITWFSLNEDDVYTAYAQSFASDGTALADVVEIPAPDLPDDLDEYNTTLDITGVIGTSDYYVSADYYIEGEGTEQHINGVYFVSHEDGASITEVTSSTSWGGYALQSLGSSGNVLVISRDFDFSSESSYTLQIFDANGDAYTEEMEFATSLDDFNIETINGGDDGFILTWTDSSYSDSESSYTSYSQIYDAEGNKVSILQTDAEDGEVYVQAGEGSTVFLISVDEDISSVSDIEDLDSDDYLEVSAEADGVTTLSTDDLYAGKYYVYQLDADGELSRSSEVIALTGEDYSVDEPEIDFEDTGYDDRDFITQAEQMTVTLTGDAVGWEYSLDHGETWIEGSGDSLYFELDRTYNLNEIQIRQFDADGVRGEISSNDIIVVQDSEVSDAVFTSIEDGLVTLELDDDLYQWEYSLDNGATFTVGFGNTFYLEPNTTYVTSEIRVQQTDKAGNISQVTNTEEVVVGDFLAPPSFGLLVDTGESDSDGVTEQGAVVVELSDDAVSWEYSVDGGDNWNTGVGAYVVLEAPITVDEDYVFYEIDPDGEIVQELTDYGEGEEVEAEIGFLLSESGNGWKYSSDGGETFTSYAWEDMEGYFFVLDEGTEYPAGEIQVRQYNEDGDASGVAVNTQDIVILGDGEDEADYIEGDDDVTDDSEGNDEDSVFVAVDLADATTSWSYSLDDGTTSEYGIAYIALNSDDANVFEDDDELRLSLDNFEAYLIDSDGNQTEMDIINEEDGYIENVFAFVTGADTAGWTYSTDGGDTFITESWGDQDGNGILFEEGVDYDSYDIQITQNYDDGTSRTALVTEDVSFEDDDGSYVIDAETALISDSDSGEYLTGTAVGDDGDLVIFTVGTLDGEEYESALLLDEDGNVVATLEGSDAFEDGEVVSLNDGQFIIFNEDVINRYSSTGELVDTATAGFSDRDEIYAIEAIADGYVVFIKDFESIDGVTHDRMYARTYNAAGEVQSTTDDLITANTDVVIKDLFVEAFSDGSFVTTWTEQNEAGTESQTYLQAFNADGAAEGSQVVIIGTNDQGWTNLSSSDFQVIASGDGGYIVLGKYDIENEETGLDEGRYYFEIYVDSDGNVTSLYDSDAGNISSSALFVGDEGDFVIAHNLVEVSGYGINVQRYNADGSTDGDAILLEADEHSFDRDPTVSALDDGGYQVEWLSDVYEDGETITIVSVQEFSSTGELIEDTTEVVIDLVGDDSTAVGTFSADETYEIYINIDVTVPEDLNAVEATWSGAENLGDDDIIILINDSVDAFSNADDELEWSFEDDSVFLTGSAILDGEGEFSVSDTFTTDLWDGEWSATPNDGLSLADVAIDDYPSDV